jgi:hypothetical protein
MCTVSLIVHDSGYLLGMNRDERIVRGPGDFPKIQEISGTHAVLPSDGAGGTWIAANQHGLTLALLNWNDVTQPRQWHQSRGIVIPRLLCSRTAGELRSTLRHLNARGCAPFRLVAVIAVERVIVEARWDTRRVTDHVLAWSSQHWFSSSLGDRRAELLRGSACSLAWNTSDAGSAAWLRRLHASHHSGLGPFSLCVHRDNVATLSYTEVVCTPDCVRMLHSVGSPCQTNKSHPTEMKRIDICNHHSLPSALNCREANHVL